MQHTLCYIFYANIFVRTVLTRYIMSIIVSIVNFCSESQFQTLLCVHYTIFSVVKLDLLIRSLLLDRILALEKTTRTRSCYVNNYSPKPSAPAEGVQE